MLATSTLYPGVGAIAHIASSLVNAKVFGLYDKGRTMR